MQTKTGVIYLQKNKFQLYSPYLSNILEFNFVSELIRDFDIANRELFDNLLKTFLLTNKIPAGSFVIVIADNASFIKDFTSASLVKNTQLPHQTPPTSPGPTLEELQTQANEFIEHIPFENVTSKTYPLPNGIRAYATNQEMFEAIKFVLEKQGFIVEVVIPSFAFGPDVSTVATLNINIINIIFQKLNLLKAYNLLTSPKSTGGNFISMNNDEKEESVDEVKPPKEKKESKPLFLIIVISVILLIIFITIGVVFWQFSNPPYKPPPDEPPVVQQSVVSPTTAPTVASSSAVAAQELTVQITSTSTSTPTANSLKSSLATFGFKSITLQTQDSLNTTQGLVLFSSRVDAQTKNTVTTEARKILGDVLVQDKADAAVDISVILGR